MRIPGDTLGEMRRKISCKISQDMSENLAVFFLNHKEFLFL